MGFLVKEIKTEHPSLGRLDGSNKRIGPVGWFGMYLTGAVLFFLLLAHLGAVHYFPAAPKMALADISRSLQSHLSLRIIDIGLLGFCILHGLIGLRRVILDLEIMGSIGDRCLTWGFAVIGAGLFIYGICVFNGLLSAGAG